MLMYVCVGSVKLVGWLVGLNVIACRKSAVSGNH